MWKTSAQRGENTQKSTVRTMKTGSVRYPTGNENM